MLKKFLIAASSGIIAGGLVDHHFESKSDLVNYGHRNNKGSRSFSGSIIDEMNDYGPFALIGIPCLLWMGPGIYLNKRLDQTLYPERWDTDYKAPAYIERGLRRRSVYKTF